MFAVQCTVKLFNVELLNPTRKWNLSHCTRIRDCIGPSRRRRAD